MTIPERHERTIQLICDEYEVSNRPWYLGFSGGKDSSALLQLVYSALLRVGRRSKAVTVLYCDTGVEIPVVNRLVLQTLADLEREAKSDGVPIRVEVAKPRLADRYFVKVIGRGYPTPTNKFRWCTDRLRINPVQRVLRSDHVRECTILLGIRRGESQERNRTIAKHRTDSDYYFRQSGYGNVENFSPIVDYEVHDVWSTLSHINKPNSVNTERLTALYKDAGSECPIVKDPKGTPCGKGRFGCWTCTVVRKDKAVSSMVEEGHELLEPLLKFRNWIAEFRDDRRYRCKRRRNGQLGPGPFTVKARKLILERLLEVQQSVPWELISKGEIDEIKRLWVLDINSNSYTEA